MKQRPNILFICGKNIRRSRTAEYIFKNDPRFNVRSAGLSSGSNRPMSEQDLNWANLVLVMEKKHAERIHEIYDYMERPVVKVLDIADEYEFMDEELIGLLQDGTDRELKKELGI